MAKISTRKNAKTAKPAEAVELPAVTTVSAVTPPPKVVGRVRTDSEDHLSTYFRDLAVHELLGPEQEREIAQGIEDQEVLTWERVFARPDCVVRGVGLVDGKTEQAVDYKKLLKAAEGLEGMKIPTPSPKKGAKKPKADPRVTKLVQAARQVAEQIRPQDVDRLLIDTVDSRGTARNECGDLLMGVEKGLFEWDSLTEIGDVISGRAPRRASADQITLYESHGMGIQDLYVAHKMVELARERGLGVDLPIGG